MTRRDERKLKYYVVRFFFKGENKVIKRGLSLSEAREHCSDPETSSSTATSFKARKLTELRGPWFDGYEEE